jgi:hypothetical protein
MTIPERDPQLQMLLDRQTIHDVLMRYSRGLDRHDRKVLESIYWPDALDDHITYRGDPQGFIGKRRLTLKLWAREAAGESIASSPMTLEFI